MSEKPSEPQEPRQLDIDFLPKIPECADKVEEMGHLDQYLQDNNAAAVLIGGVSRYLSEGAHLAIIDARKDLDALVIQGGQHMVAGHSPWDLFLPQQDGTYENRNGFTLGYHVHHLGEHLDPGLYQLPPEAILLTEAEMQTRRAIDRTIPELLDLKSGQIPTPLKPLPLNDIVLEFPGDLSWYANVRHSFPIQTIVRSLPGDQRRTYMSFKPRTTSQFPVASAFPDHRSIRAPETAKALDILPTVQPSPAQAYQTTSELLKKGFVVEAVNYLIEKAPEKADSFSFLQSILESHQIDCYPLKRTEALAIWLKHIRDQNCLLRLLLNGSFDLENLGLNTVDFEKNGINKQLRRLADEILAQYGGSPQCLELAERLRGLDIEQFMAFEGGQEEAMAVYREQLQKHLLTFDYWDRSKGLRRSPFSGRGGRDYIQFFRSFGSQGRQRFSLFSPAYYQACQQLGVSDEDLYAELSSDSTINRLVKSSLSFGNWGGGSPEILFRKPLMHFQHLQESQRNQTAIEIYLQRNGLQAWHNLTEKECVKDVNEKVVKNFTEALPEKYQPAFQQKFTELLNQGQYDLDGEYWRDSNTRELVTTSLLFNTLAEVIIAQGLE